MKLSHRLNSLQRMIKHPYRHIWDCCCDHGLLGAALLTELQSLSLATTADDTSQNKAWLKTTAPLQTRVHFVDIIPSLMQQVEDKLQRFFPQGKQAYLESEPDSLQAISWQVHCLDVAQLQISTDNSRQLIIIAGVGGALTLKLVQAICLAYPLQPLDFLLCPVHHQFELRQGLTALNLGLIDEKLIVENRRFYELIYVSSQSTTELSAQGDLLWRQDNKLSRAYLKRTLAHYTNMLRSAASETNVPANMHDEHALEPINTQTTGISAQPLLTPESSTVPSYERIRAIIEAYEKIQSQLTTNGAPET